MSVWQILWVFHFLLHYPTCKLIKVKYACKLTEIRIGMKLEWNWNVAEINKLKWTMFNEFWRLEETN